MSLAALQLGAVNVACGSLWTCSLNAAAHIIYVGIYFAGQSPSLKRKRNNPPPKQILFFSFFFFLRFQASADTDANPEHLQMNKYGGFVRLAPRHSDRTFSCWQATETSPAPAHCRPALTIIRRCTLTAHSSRGLETSSARVRACV